jgi:hypothetical protein
VATATDSCIVYIFHHSNTLSTPLRSELTMPLAFRIAILVLGSGAVVFSAWLRAMHIRSRSWPSVRGRIIRSALQADPHDAGSSLEIEYEFSVRGRTLTSCNLAYAVMRDDARARERLVAQYPVGTEVDVFYNPENPKSSVLLRPQSSGWYWLAGVGLVFVLIGVAAP